jgi:hypothetical protein
MKAYLFAVLMLLLSVSCEKDISFNLANSPSQLVVEATIENGGAPKVILSNSLNYFSEISPEILEASFVHGAIVVVSNGTKSQTLKEYSSAVDSNGYKIYVYTSDTLDQGNNFTGEFESAYDLTITANGQKYTAHTTIPALAKKVDSLWWKPAPNNPDTNKVILRAKVTDPPGYGNYVRYFTSTNGGPFYPGLNSVFDDQIVDGTTYDIDVDKGVNRNQSIDLKNYAFFERGDTVVAKLCNIDKATYDFWRTMEYNYQSIGNPFSSPTKVLGNISNNALGYFGGYAAQYMSITIPK